MSFACALILAAAGVPGGHVYIGGRISWIKPVGSGDALFYPLTDDVGFSFDLSLELRHAFFDIGFEHGGYESKQPEFSFASARAGYAFGSGSIAPFIAAGGGAMSMTAWTSYDRGTPVHPTGAAFVGEAGLMFPRSARFGRARLCLRLIEPLFDAYRPVTGGSISNPAHLLLFTVRVFL